MSGPDPNETGYAAILIVGNDSYGVDLVKAFDTVEEAIKYSKNLGKEWGFKIVTPENLEWPSKTTPPKD